MLGNERNQEIENSGEEDQKCSSILHYRKCKLVPKDLNYILSRREKGKRHLSLKFYELHDASANDYWW